MINTKTIIEIDCNDGDWQKAILITWSEVDNQELWTQLKGFKGPYLEIASTGTGPADTIEGVRKELHYLLDSAFNELEHKRLRLEEE